MMNKAGITAVLLTALLLSGCSGSTNGSVSGTFSGEAVGMGGEYKLVQVTLTLEGTTSKELTAVGEGETDGIGSKAIEEMPAKIVASNSLDVEVTTGATITSGAIIEAAEKALAKAGLKPSDLGK